MGYQRGGDIIIERESGRDIYAWLYPILLHIIILASMQRRCDPQPINNNLS